MANIRVKNIPEKLHNRLRRYARDQKCTLGEIILEAIKRELSRREWHKRLSRRSSTQLRSLAADLLEEERRQRSCDSQIRFKLETHASALSRRQNS